MCKMYFEVPDSARGCAVALAALKCWMFHGDFGRQPVCSPARQTSRPSAPLEQFWTSP
jgi:hypothetical protein